MQKNISIISKCATFPVRVVLCKVLYNAKSSVKDHPDRQGIPAGRESDPATIMLFAGVRRSSSAWSSSQTSFPEMCFLQSFWTPCVLTQGNRRGGVWALRPLWMGLEVPHTLLTLHSI